MVLQFKLVCDVCGAILVRKVEQMALRGQHVRILLHDDILRQKCEEAAVHAGATLLDATSDQQPTFVVAESAVGTEFLVNECSDLNEDSLMAMQPASHEV